MPPLAPVTLAALAVAALVLLLAWLAVRERRRRRGAERVAAEIGRRLRAISGRMRESVVAYDLQNRVLFVNPAFETLTGFTPAELHAGHFIDYVHPDDRTAVLAEWESVKSGNSMLGQEYRIVTRDGRIRWVSGSWEPLRDEVGRQMGVLGAELDITERRRGEEELRREAELIEQLAMVQRTAAAAALDPDAVLRVVSEQARALTGATGVTLELRSGDTLVPRVQLGARAPRVDPRQSLAWLATRTAMVQRLDDANLSAADRQAWAAAGARSMIALPVTGGDAVGPVGALVAVSSEPDAFGDRERRVLDVLGGMIGVALSLAGAVGARQVRLEERTRALQESEARFKQLVDAAQEGIWVLDDRGVTTYVNSRLATMLGFEGGEMLGRALGDFADSGTRPEIQRRVGRDSGPRATNGDVRLRRKDGAELWAIMATSPIIGRDGTWVGTVGMLTDITERKRAEEGLRHSAERQRVLHEIDQAVLAARTLGEVGRVALSRLRRLVPCYRCSALLFDFERGEAHLFAGFVGSDALTAAPIPLSDLSPPETLRLGTVRYVADLAAAASRAPYLDQLVADGIRSVLTVPLLVDGDVVGELNLAATTPDAFGPEHRDMAQELAVPLAIAAQQARLRGELRQQTAELERRLAERTAELRGATGELDTLAYAIAHELRAPLRQVSGFAQILLDEHAAALGCDAAHYAERIRDGAAALGELLHGLAQLARIGRQDLLRRPTALGPLVEEIGRELEPDAGARDFRWQVGELPVVIADPALLRVAITELMRNAVKFTATREHAVARIFCVREEEQIGLAIADNGVGFDPAQAERLFQPFQRLHRADEFTGLGLGLALADRVARRHGGEVRAEAEPGGGATFVFTVAAAGR